jgi:hypothetical protein
MRSEEEVKESLDQTEDIFI